MLKATDIDIPRIRDTVGSLMEEHHVPGLSLGVVSADGLVYAEGFGLADIESGRPHAPELRHRIGSISKTMVGLCTMALVDEGRLSLAAKLIDHLPEITFHGPAESLTVWHLLTHTGGIGEAPNVKDLADPFGKLFTDRPPPASLAEAYAEGITLEVPPGTKWAYANHGYMLLGEIVSRLEKAPLQEVMRVRIFEPLGMADTDIADRPNDALTTGYHRNPGPDERELLARIGQDSPPEETVDGYNVRGSFQALWQPAAGAVQSTIPGMARYASALLRQSRGIVRPQTFDSMVSPQWCPDPRLPARGLSFHLQPLFGRRTFGHSGAVFGGWNSDLTVFPDEDLAVIVHMNLMYDRAERVFLPVIQAVLGAPAFRPPAAKIAPRILATAPGVYEAPTPGPLTNFRIMTQCGRVQVSAGDGGLTLHSRRGPWKEGVRMWPAADSQADLFVLGTGDPEPPRVAALLDETGAVTGIRLPQFVDMYRNDALEPWA